MLKKLFLAAALTLLGMGAALPALAQSRDVKGRILDEADLPLPGAFVTVKGETRGAMTDVDGRFEISVKPSDVLVVSFLGYQDEEVKVGDQKDILVKLIPQANQLEEVVKVAYGTQKKASVIGSITTVDASALQAPVGVLSTGLAGKLAGVVAVQHTGEPGSSAEFWIRGVNTFGANAYPLILVDGVERSMDLVDTEDIASFSILKDATATALYGVRGANGIVLITTKRGSESKPKVNAKVETGVSAPTQLPEMASAEQFIDYLNAMQPGTIDDYARRMYLSGENPDLYPNVDWIHEIFKQQAMNTRANVNVTGGTKNVRYYAGGSYYFEDGIFNVEQNDRYNSQMNYSRFNFRTNVDINITPSTTLGMDISTQFTRKNKPGSDISEIYAYTMQITPIGFPKVFSDGTLSNPQNGSNPYNLINNMGYAVASSQNAQTTVALTQDFSDIITEGLTAKVQVSWDAKSTSSYTNSIRPRVYYLAWDQETESYEYMLQGSSGTGYINKSGTSIDGQTVLNIEASSNYERTFANAHRVGGMFLWYLRERTSLNPASYWTTFPYKSLGIAGRATYSYVDRYFAEFNFGYNGSENFAPGHRFGFFPSGAVGWIVSNEKFWEPVKDVVSLFKIKGSIGKVGNDQIGGGRRFGYITTMDTSGISGFNWGLTNPVYTSGVATGDIGNPGIVWEEALKRNVGIELNFWRDHIKLQVDYFNDYRSGIFITRESMPSVVGLRKTQYINIGEMQNAGFDGSAQFEYLFPGGLSVSARANYTFNRNRRVFDDKPDQVWAYQNTAGFANNQQRGLIAEGLFMTQEEIDTWPTQTFGSVQPGDIKYRDVNGDGQVDSYDQVAIGYTTVPEINYGFGLSLGWKGIDASVFFSGVDHVTRFIGGYNLYGGAATNVLVQGQVFADVIEKSWSVTGDPDAEYPRFSVETPANNQVRSTYWQKDMSFLRLKNAEIGYTLPKTLTKKVGISALRVYLQGVNLLTFSKFKLWDPELESSYGNVYPLTRNVSLGLNLNF
ncbi:MAG: TonB-dependent receptor [Bacteroidales bacterium]|nr:TonB-dependent receptor [Bacteroidales bacterium]MBO4565831.1 TonB-dependent receptor [Bacteroidales bacterium]